MSVQIGGETGCVDLRPAGSEQAEVHGSPTFGTRGLGRALNLEGRQVLMRVTAIPGGMRSHFFDRFVDQSVPVQDEAVLQEYRNAANTIVLVAQMLHGSVVLEIVLTSPFEGGWP